MSRSRRLRILFEAAAQQLCGSRAGVSAGSAVQSGSVVRTDGQRVGDVVALEGAPAGQHLVEHAAERPDVAALVDRPAPAPAPGSCRPPCRGSSRRLSSSPGVVIVGDCDTSGDAPPAGSSAFARPKSSTFTVPSGRTLMFAGFRSRWMMPCSCAASSASAICFAIGSASSSGIGAARDALRQIVALDEFHHERA